MWTRVKNQIRELNSALWFRPAILCMLAVAVAILISIADAHIERGSIPWLPEIDLSTVRQLLQLLAGSMLTVATVTLSMLMLVLSIAAGQASPRAVPELMSDPVTQNALGTFLATFVFSLSSLLFFGLGMTSGAGLTLTFAACLVFLFAAIFYFIQWIGHVANSLKLNRMAERIYDQGHLALTAYLSTGKSETSSSDERPPDEGLKIQANEAGYVQFVDRETLGRLAVNENLRVHLFVREGSFVHPARSLMAASGERPVSNEVCEKLCKTIVVNFERSHKGDPLLVFELLAEVASRALSPGINDPQTALTCIKFLGALLCQASVVGPADYPPEVTFDGRVRIESPQFGQMLERALLPVVRDGAGYFEVMSVILETIEEITVICDQAYLDDLEDVCSRSAKFAKEGLTLDQDKDALKTLERRMKTKIDERRSEN